MKVKIELCQSGVQKYLYCPQIEENTFPKFSHVNLSLYEKTCPFCGKPLYKAECRCEKYRKAKAALLATFEENHLLWVKPTSKPLSNVVLNADDLVITPTDAPDNALLIFDEGMEAEFQNMRNTEKWLISQGELTTDGLKFFIRKRGNVQYYLCEIKNLPADILSKLENATKIEICYIENETIINPNAPKGTLGNYHLSPKEHVVAEYLYDEYLSKLKEF